MDAPMSNRPLAPIFRTLLLIYFCCVVYAMWFGPYLAGEEIQRIAVLFVVWHILGLIATRDPGYITPQNKEYYANIYGLDEDGEVRRSGPSMANPTRRVARYDHSNYFLRVDVGQRNHFAYYSLLVYSIVCFAYVWYLAIWVLSGAREIYNRPKYAPPVIWELMVMFALCMEVYLRLVIYGTWSLICLGVKHYFPTVEGQLMVTKDAAWDNLVWVTFYAPGTAFVTLVYYGTGYMLLFLAESVMCATGNLTFQEAMKMCQETVISRTHFRSFAGLMFTVNQESIGAITGQDLYKKMLIWDPVEGEDKPEGTFDCDSVPHTLLNLYGTLPNTASPNTLGSVRSNLYAMYFGSTTPYLRTNESLPRARHRSPSQQAEGGASGARLRSASQQSRGGGGGGDVDIVVHS